MLLPRAVRAGARVRTAARARARVRPGAPAGAGAAARGAAARGGGRVPAAARAAGSGGGTPRRAVTALLLACCLVSCSGGSGAADAARPGAQGVGDVLFPTAGNGGYDVGHYGLELSYDPGSGHLTGTADITATTARGGLSRFDLDLTGMTVTQVTVDGRPAASSRDGDELVVTPQVPLPGRHPFRTVVAYQGVPGTVTDPDGSREGWFRTSDGAQALGEPVGSKTWFPGNDHPSDKATYDITVSVPDGLTAVSNGELAGTAHTAGRTSYHWHVGQPMATYLATVAIGHFRATTARSTTGVPVYTAVDPRSNDPETAAALARIPEILDWENTVFGPYPFSSAGAIVAHLSDGEGGYAMETQNRPSFTGNEGTPAVALDTLVHEMSHEYFGDTVTPSDWQDIWLNEGFATYAQWMWDEHAEGDSVDSSAQAAFAGTGTWSFPPATPTAVQLFGSPVYERGALVLYEVRRAIGAAAFARLLRDWPAAHRYGNATTRDFTAFCARYTAKDLTPLFATWLYSPAKPLHL